jgi:hypothetical protein
MQIINQTKSRLSENSIKTDKSLAKLTKRRREKTHINQIKNKKGIS